MVSARLASSTLTAGLLLAFASPAFGHALLMSPVPRTTNDGTKTGPCGADPVTVPGASSTYAPGSQINVLFMETIDHPGYYRIAFSPDGTNVFDQNILANDLPDVAGSSRATPTEYMVQVTLPDIECDSCVIQMIQYMTENPATPSLYYSCADIKLQRGATNPGTGTGDGSGGGGGAADDGSGGGDDTEDMYGPEPGFCSVRAPGRGGAPTTATLGLLVGLAGVLALRRRR